MASVVPVFLFVLAIYLLLGLLFSIAFLWKGLYQVDEGAVGTSFFFKLIILPGVVLLWPALLLKWTRS